MRNAKFAGVFIVGINSVVVIVGLGTTCLRAQEGRFLAIGLNKVDADHYGSEKPLRGCHFDARAMASIAAQQGFDIDDSLVLLDEGATTENVIAFCETAANELEHNDLFMLTIAAHGGQIFDANGDERERNSGDSDDDQPDTADETWYLYDRQFLDDEVFELLAKFKAGVRVLVVADTCHAGTFLRYAEYRGGEPVLKSLNEYSRAIERDIDNERSTRSADKSGGFFINSGGGNKRDIRGSRGAGGSRPNNQPNALDPYQGTRTQSFDAQKRIFDRNRDEYIKLFEETKAFRAEANRGNSLPTRVIGLGACQDHQLAGDGDANGLFTENLKRVYNNGSFRGNYLAFVQAIDTQMPPYQKPSYQLMGAVIPNVDFDGQQPFKLGP